MLTPEWDLLIRNVHLATMIPDSGYGTIHHGALAIHNGRIVWIGPESTLPPDKTARSEYDGHGGWLTPGLIDCHTHIVYAGNRSDEFEDRLNGVGYQEIARRGGGILSTVRATRAASADSLLAQSLPRIIHLLNEGVTTLEIKSGYGLDLHTERTMLSVARRIGQILPVHITTTFLGAHAVPPEFSEQKEAYLNMICHDMLPTLASEGLIDAVDAFCEQIGFSHAQTEQLFRTARSLGLPVKLHAEQLSNQGGAALVAQYQGLSADHLEYLDDTGIAEMVKARTVAVLLPGAFYFLREPRRPPIDALRQARVPMAVATDCNPGTSPLTSLLLAMNMACTLFHLSPQEALAGTTRHAARALGLANEIGTLEVGKIADLALWNINRPAELAYHMGFNPCQVIINKGILRNPASTFP